MSRALRVAIAAACPYPVPQGSQVYVSSIARALQIAGHDVHLVTYGYGASAESEQFPLHRAWNPPFASRTSAGLSWAKPLQDWALWRKLREIASTHAIDLINAHNYEALIAALHAGVRPIVYHAHNAMAEELPHFLPAVPGVRALGAWLDRTFPRRADAVIVPHGRLKAYLCECGCAAERVHVIPPPLDARAFAGESTVCERPAIIYAGNLDRYQNLCLLEQVLPLVRRQIPNAELVIATHAPGAVPGARMVRLTDFDSLRDTLLQEAVFVCPRTSWSGYPIKLLNAMAAGLPAVCCEGAAYPLSHGETGCVVPDNDATAFAEAVVNLLRSADTRRQMGARARERVIEHHDPARIGNLTVDVLGRLTQEKFGHDLQD